MKAKYFNRSYYRTDPDCYPYFLALFSFNSLNYPWYLKVSKDLRHYLQICFLVQSSFGKIRERKLTFLKVEEKMVTNWKSLVQKSQFLHDSHSPNPHLLNPLQKKQMKHTQLCFWDSQSLWIVQVLSSFLERLLYGLVTSICFRSYYH